jgi:hypothetical protein
VGEFSKIEKKQRVQLPELEGLPREGAQKLNILLVKALYFLQNNMERIKILL